MLFCFPLKEPGLTWSNWAFIAISLYYCFDSILSE